MRLKLRLQSPQGLELGLKMGLLITGLLQFFLGGRAAALAAAQQGLLSKDGTTAIMIVPLTAQVIDRIEPVLPIDRIDPAEPMLRMQPAEPIDPAEAKENNEPTQSAEN